MQRKLIGRVGVDSGRLLIVDPGYLSRLARSNAHQVESGQITAQCDEPQQDKTFEIGVKAETGGDGTFAVYAEVDEKSARIVIEGVYPWILE